MDEIGQKGIAPSFLVDLLPNMGVEVAVRAFRDAERPVNIEGEGVAIAQNSAAFSLANAAARWLIRCFSSGSISPNVWS